MHLRQPDWMSDEDAMAIQEKILDAINRAVTDGNVPENVFARSSVTVEVAAQETTDKLLTLLRTM